MTLVWIIACTGFITCEFTLKWGCLKLIFQISSWHGPDGYWLLAQWGWKCKQCTWAATLHRSNCHHSANQLYLSPHCSNSPDQHNPLYCILQVWTAQKPLGIFHVSLLIEILLNKLLLSIVLCICYLPALRHCDCSPTLSTIIFESSRVLVLSFRSIMYTSMPFASL